MRSESSSPLFIIIHRILGIIIVISSFADFFLSHLSMLSRLSDSRVISQNEQTITLLLLYVSAHAKMSASRHKTFSIRLPHHYKIYLVSPQNIVNLFQHTNLIHAELLLYFYEKYIFKQFKNRNFRVGDGIRGDPRGLLLLRHNPLQGGGDSRRVIR